MQAPFVASAIRKESVRTFWSFATTVLAFITRTCGGQVWRRMADMIKLKAALSKVSAPGGKRSDD